MKIGFIGSGKMASALVHGVTQSGAIPRETIVVTDIFSAAAKKLADASRFDIGVARASRLPKLNAFSNAGYINYLGTLRFVVQALRHGRDGPVFVHHVVFAALLELTEIGRTSCRERV